MGDLVVGFAVVVVFLFAFAVSLSVVSETFVLRGLGERRRNRWNCWRTRTMRMGKGKERRPPWLVFNRLSLHWLLSVLELAVS